MLTRAFVETADYRALIETKDFNFVVGRRGTGKSALFARTKSYFETMPQYFVLSDALQEYHVLEIQQILRGLGIDYRLMRAITRLTWRAHLLLSVLERLEQHWKLARVASYEFVKSYKEEFSDLFRIKGFGRCLSILKAHCATTTASEIPGRIASHLRIDELQENVNEALEGVSRSVIFLYDGLDEGWEPDIASTAILGGLALTIAEFVDKSTDIHGVLFIRDNMFRSLAHFDNDFSRHVEGNSLRLHWDESSLLHLVANRLRIFLSVETIESDIKVWNRFAHRELRERSGFQKCLQHTLYRPRDILVLLNRAYVVASRQGRTEIVEADVEVGTKDISNDRLQDLFKEYDAVLPGLKHFVRLFEGGTAFSRFREILDMLDEAVTMDADDLGARDFALFGSGRQIFFALYSVGVLGIQDQGTSYYRFCHDGSTSELDNVADDRLILVHPCYWRALGISGEGSTEELLIQINDEYEPAASTEIGDLRIRQLGQVVEQLPRLEIGHDGSREFEQWVFKATKILFAGRLTNFELKPNPSDAAQQRDLVATNLATDGFWKRILDDYQARQVVFEVKNYESLKPEDFRQVLSYSSGEYGRFAIIVTRSASEGISEAEKTWVQTMFHEHGRLILILPAVILSRCISKLRTARKHDYTEDVLNKRMDSFVRSHLSLKHSHKYRKRKR